MSRAAAHLQVQERLLLLLLLLLRLGLLWVLMTVSNVVQPMTAVV
jgi:hypothetical protein